MRAYANLEKASKLHNHDCCSKTGGGFLYWNLFLMQYNVCVWKFKKKILIFIKLNCFTNTKTFYVNAILDTVNINIWKNSSFLCFGVKLVYAVAAINWTEWVVLLCTAAVRFSLILDCALDAHLMWQKNFKLRFSSFAPRTIFWTVLQFIERSRYDLHELYSSENYRASSTLGTIAGYGRNKW